jgi:integrase
MTVGEHPATAPNTAGIHAGSRAPVGMEGFHFHDLRHTGNNYASATGANLRELMACMGHETTRVAVIYQHATAQRDQRIAAELSELINRGFPN